MSELLKPATTLRAFVARLNTAEVRAAVPSGIYQKGRDYYQDGLVGEVEITQKGTIKAEVFGTDEYEVKLSEKNGGVYGKCSCPYGREWGGPCKHIAAVLLHLCEEKPEGEWPETHEKSTNKAGDVFEKFLARQSKEQLIQLVRQLASPEFRAEIAMRHGSPDAKAQTLLDVRAKITRLLAKDWEDRTLADLDPKIGAQLQRLHGAWDFDPDAIAQLFAEIIGGIGAIMENGGLYGDYEEYSDEPEETLEHLLQFLQALPSPVRVRVLPGIWAAEEKSDFGNFADLWEAMPEYLAPEDVPALRANIARYLPNLSEGQQLVLFDKISPAIGERERLQFLETQLEKGQWHFAELYGQAAERAGKAEPAFRRLRDWAMAQKSEGYFSSKTLEPLFAETLRLAQKTAAPLAPICQKLVEMLPSKNTLLQLAALDPANLKKYEATVERQNAAQFLQYLEAQGRLAEAVQRLEKTKPDENQLLRAVGSNETAQFYARHAAQFPTEARRCFFRILEANLPYPSGQHYDNVTEALRLLQPLLHAADFQAKVADIRANYPRRRLLLEKLDAKFGRAR